MPERAGELGLAAPTVVPAPAWSAPASGWPAAAPLSGPMPAVGAGYGYSAPVPQGWTLPTPSTPVSAPAPEVAPPGGNVRWEQPHEPARPAPRRGGAGLGILVGVLVACLVLGAGAVAWFAFLQPDAGSSSADGALGGRGGSVPSPAEDTTDEATDDTAVDTTDGGTAGGEDDGGAGTDGTPSSGDEPTTPTVDPEAEAVALMNALATEGLAATPLDGRWVAQLASKSVGTTDPLQVAANGTHVFYGTDILVEHESLQQQIGGSAYVFVLFSTDFGRHSVDGAGRPYWVTLADAGFGSAEDVRAWCRDAFPTLTPQQLANACVARTLEPSHP